MTQRMGGAPGTPQIVQRERGVISDPSRRLARDINMLSDSIPAVYDGMAVDVPVIRLLPEEKEQLRKVCRTYDNCYALCVEDPDGVEWALHGVSREQVAFLLNYVNEEGWNLSLIAEELVRNPQLLERFDFLDLTVEFEKSDPDMKLGVFINSLNPEDPQDWKKAHLVFCLYHAISSETEVFFQELADTFWTAAYAHALIDASRAKEFVDFFVQSPYKVMGETVLPFKSLRILCKEMCDNLRSSKPFLALLKEVDLTYPSIDPQIFVELLDEMVRLKTLNLPNLLFTLFPPLLQSKVLDRIKSLNLSSTQPRAEDFKGLIQKITHLENLNLQNADIPSVQLDDVAESWKKLDLNGARIGVELLMQLLKKAPQLERIDLRKIQVQVPHSVNVDALTRSLSLKEVTEFHSVQFLFLLLTPHMPQLRTVSFPDYGFTRSLLTQLPGIFFHRLSTLWIERIENKDLLPYLFQRTPNLTSLKIPDPGLYFEECPIPRLNHLEELTLRGSKLCAESGISASGFSLRALLDIMESSPQLQTLNLQNFFDITFHIRDIFETVNLFEIDFFERQLAINQQQLTRLYTFPHLLQVKELDLSCAADQVMTQSLFTPNHLNAFLNNMPLLEVLDLSGRLLVGEDLHKEALAHLKILKLNNSPTLHIQMLIKLLNLAQNLSYLELRGTLCNFEDLSLQHGSLSQLKFLDLSRSNINDDTIARFASYNPPLQILMVVNCSHIAHPERLQELFPGATLVTRE